ncbi:oxidoreductase [Metallosphaera tengchongensis]|uniref:Oxidoreductase n=1 Tax=Metallosphaera tengchongensis TaxID=1532350 RepID=A0A6N0NWN7_9CREN|nr:FAD-dependent oxidoreductase [Metallosphaera tengchongensis]QKR00615.1 oxidoreductase [Metallosphaera tengchongensis]
MDKHADYVIIGSGVAGYHALTELLSKKVIMITSDQDFPYDRPPLSKEYLRGEVEKPFFNPPEFYAEHKVEIMLNTEVERIDNTSKEVVLKGGRSVSFDKALIATGGRPRKLNVSGEELPGVKYLRSLRDCDSIKESIAKGVKRPVIVGGGFIGIEVASSLVKLGLRPTIIEALPHIWTSFVREDISKHVMSYLQSRGIEIITGEGVKEIVGRSKVEGVVTQGGKRVDGDLVLVAVGILPNVEVAQRSGIAVENGILADEHLRTSFKDVYVAGDVANVMDPITKKRRRIEHWNNAQYTGVIAAKNMMGGEEKYDFLSTVWSDIFDLHIESAGETREYEDYVLRGNVDSNSFVSIYLKGGEVCGYVAFNRDERELSTLNNLIVKRVPVSNLKEKLKDQSFDLSST